MSTALPVLQHTDPSTLTRKDFVPPAEVKWCPGCVDYSILNQVQKLLPTLGIPRENFCFVSGIGCSSRFPYYMETFGLHTIHGRAPAIATGLKLARPDLDVWVVTGDGDSLAIGGNHFMHALRRNVGLKILLFNNRIYGLTKGQFSPTSEIGKVTKSAPLGSIDYPIDPVGYALGSGATFIGRAMGNDGQQLGDVLARAAAHKGTALVEIFTNCVIFNDGAFDQYTENKAEQQLRMEHGKPLRFGKDGDKGIAIDSHGRPVIVAGDAPNVLIHDERSDALAFLLARLNPPEFPMSFGVFRAVERAPYEQLATAQVERAKAKKKADLAALLNDGETWEVR
jgi:2-oxoglutarate ferredoxin oxidoreductase subunit beta